MKQLKEYIKEGLFDDIDKQEGKNNLAAQNKQLKKEIVDWISDYYLESYNKKLKKRSLTVDMSTIPPTVDYKGDLNAKKISTLNNHGMFQWGEVEGDFNCGGNRHLTSLEGCPKKVGGYFYCDQNVNLTSLEYAPSEVGGNFYCNDTFDSDDVKKVSNVKGKIVRSEIHPYYSDTTRPLR